MFRKVSMIILPMAAGAALSAAAISGFGVPQLSAAPSAEVYRHLHLFGDVFERVRSEYVEAPSEEELIESAVNGMLSSLDPHSSYLSAKNFRDMQVQTRGEFGGLGIEVTMEDGLVKVVTPIDETPAARAGIISGDLIVEINGEQVRGLKLSEAVERMRGKVNSTIDIKVIRENADKPLDFTITREVIKVRSVRHEIQEDIGYVRISSFTEQTLSGLRTAFEKIDAEIGIDKVQGYVVDLRSNPGGLLDQAVAVSDAFLDRGEIVSTRGRDPQKIDRYTAREGDLANGKPVVILINGGSASASEIVAGALQDQERATIIGTKSFGKGSVQTIIPIGQNGAIRLTTARYYTPSGVSIQAKGIDPDIKIIQELPDELKDQIQARSESSLRGHLGTDDGAEEGSGSVDFVPQDREEDAQLQYALKLLRGEETNEAFIAGSKSASLQ